MQTNSKPQWVDFFMNCIRNPRASDFFLKSSVPSFTRAILESHPCKETLNFSDISKKTKRSFEEIIDLISSLDSSQQDPYQYLHKIRDEVLFDEFTEAFIPSLVEAIEYRVDFLTPHILGDSVLDIGCGTGSLLDALKQKNPRLDLYGIDPYIQTSQSGIRFSDVDLTDPTTVSPYQADTGLLFHVLHHMGDSEDRLLNFLSRLDQVSSKRLLVIEDTLLNHDIAKHFLSIQSDLSSNPSFRDYLALDKKDQEAVLSIIDVVINVGVLGLQYMPFPFLYRSPQEWMEIFFQAGWQTQKVLPIKTFAPNYFFHGPYCFFVLDRVDQK